MTVENLDYNYTLNNLPKDLGKMKIKNIKPVGKKPVYEITVDKAHSYVLQNGVIKTNTGLMYSADCVFIIGRQQEKEGSDLVGYNFVINIEKSRHTKEKSKIAVTVKHDGGLDIYSGLLDIALETGHVIKPSNGWYQRVFDGVAEEHKWRAKDTSTKEFWDALIYDDPSFDEAIGKIYKVANADLFSKDPEEMSEEELFDAIEE